MTKEHQEYIANMLRHASYKKYENYVLSQLYWKLIAHGIELKLITQQTVFRDDIANHVAYMDGYFPALNIQIEVDEQHHKFQQAADKKREKDIMHALGAIQLESKPKVLRIDTTKDIDMQIDDCVKFIDNMWHMLGMPKWEDTSLFDVVRNQKCIKYNDNMVFKLKCELVNAIGLKTRTGKTYSKHGTQSISLVKFENDVDIWFPCISDNIATGWMNKYDTKHHVFSTQLVSNFKRNHRWLRYKSLFDNGMYNDRYIFFKVIDAFNNRGYKYYGKYRCISCDAKNQKEVWKRISTDDIKIA